MDTCCDMKFLMSNCSTYQCEFGCGISKKVRPKSKILAKNQHAQRKPLYSVNTKNDSSSNNGHYFRKYNVSKRK